MEAQVINLPVIIISLCVLALGVFLDKKIKLPLGVTCLGGAFLLAQFALDTPVQKFIVSNFPSQVIMTMMLAMSFFGFFAVNGTSKVLGSKISRLLKGNLRAAPWIFLIIGAPMCMLLGMGSCLYIYVPLVFSTFIAAGVNPIMAVATAYLPLIIGNFNPFMGTGVATRAGYLSELGYTNISGVGIGMWVACVSLILFVYVVVFFITKTYKLPNVEFSSDSGSSEQLSPVHKKSLYVMAGVVVAFVLPAIVKLVAPGPFATTISNLFSSFNVFLFGIVAVIVLNLCDWKGMIKNVQVPTFFMITGVYMLIKAMSMAGLDSLLGMVASSVPHWLIPPILVLLVAFLSFFVSAAALTPMTFPLAFSLATTPAEALLYLSCVLTGGAASGISPISTMGAMILGLVPAEQQTEYSKNMFKAAFIFPSLMAVAAATGIVGLVCNLFTGMVY